MIRKQDGFTMVELIISMAVLVFALAAASQILIGLVAQFKQQTKITETNTEGMIGLEMLRGDIEQAGFGLPFDINGAAYNEAVNDLATAHNETNYNDSATSDPPRALVSGDGDGEMWCAGAVCSDVLVVKALSLSLDDATQRWTYVVNRGVNNRIPVWRDRTDAVLFDKNLRPNTLDNTVTDRVIVIRPKLGDRRNVLILSGGVFFTNFNPGNTDPPDLSSSFSPELDSFETYMIYGIRTDAGPRMPFNRADYYVRVPGTVPARCAQGTGILYKATVNHADGQLIELPLLDCVADMQVEYGLDIDSDGDIDSSTADISALNAEDIRQQLKEIRVFVLAHEGQRDATYTFNNFITPPPACGATCIRVGDATGGRDLDMQGIANYLNYRWKVYTMIIKPINVRVL